MLALVNINGEISNEKNAKISVFDRGFLYGDSVYEVTQTLDFLPVKLKEHLDRLYQSASKIGIEFDFTREFIIKQIFSMIKKFKKPNTYIRIIITRGEGEIGLDPNLSSSNNFILIIKELPKNPDWWYQKGVHMVLAQTKRNPIDSIDPSIKSGNYLNNVLAIREAKAQGAFDAIMLNHEGYISEGTTSNIWIVTHQNEIWTPPSKAGILAGITRKTLLQLAHFHSFDVYEKNFTALDLKSAKECFLTSSTRYIVPITQIDKKLIGTGKPGKITLKLLKIFRDDLRKELENAQD